MKQMRRLVQEGAPFLLAMVKPVARSVRENVGLAVLSVVLAFGLWIFVSDTGNPTRTGGLALDLMVVPVNPPADVVVVNELATVRPRIRVAQDVWESLTSADFKATVDLAGLRAGTYELPIKVTAATSQGGLSVLGALPSQIEVKVEPLFSKSVPVIVEVKGEPPAGFTMGSPEVEQKTALVTGPQEKVDLASQSVARLDVSGRS